MMDSLENIQDILESCLLPQLKHDLDSIPIEKEHFRQHHEILLLHLPLLYDWIQQQPRNWISSGDGNEKTKQIQGCLIVLLCELGSSEAIFKLNSPELIKNAERILQNYHNLTKDVEQIVFKYYEDKLHKDCWKRQLGAVHGFVKYLQFRFEDSRDHDQNMSHQFLTFSLSVALNIRCCYETHYKLLSTRIFVIMLQHGANDDILSINIHSVIYDAVFKDIHIMDSIPFVRKQWKCLIKCLDFYKDFDSFTWNYLDDMMEVLLRNISLAPDSSTSICLIEFVSKLIVYFTINHKEFEEKLNTDWTQFKNINECRLLGITNTSYTNYRWAKTILQMFIIESHKLMQTTDICQQMLTEIHRCYIVGILPISLSVIEPHLITFFEKFILVLMEVVKVQKYHETIMQTITCLLETFYYHLKNCDKSLKLHEFKEAIYNLIKVETFKKYSSI